LNDFIFKWTVLVKSLALNFLRNLAIVKNRSKGATSIEIFLSKLYSSNVDIAISDVGRFRLNKDSKVSYTQSVVSVFSHPYEKLLSRIGYSIVIDMQKSQALMNFTTYMFSEYHIMIYGVKKIIHSHMERLSK